MALKSGEWFFRFVMLNRLSHKSIHLNYWSEILRPPLYAWVKKFSKASDADSKDDQAAENRRLKRELARVTEERDILKKATVYFARDAK